MPLVLRRKKECIYICMSIYVYVCMYIHIQNMQQFFKKLIFFIHVFLAVLSLRCFVQAFSSCRKWGLLFTAVHSFSLWLLLVQSSGSRMGFSSCSIRAQWLWHVGLAAPWYVGSSQIRDGTHVPCMDRRILIHYATMEVPATNFYKWPLSVL